MTFNACHSFFIPLSNSPSFISFCVFAPASGLCTASKLTWLLHNRIGAHTHTHIYMLWLGVASKPNAIYDILPLPFLVIIVLRSSSLLSRRLVIIGWCFACFCALSLSSCNHFIVLDLCLSLLLTHIDNFTLWKKNTHTFIQQSKVSYS